MNLWGRVRGAVLTSATLATCGSFEYFKAEAGLNGDAAVRTAVVQSPFDYRKQGQLVIRKTTSAPRHLNAYNTEVAQLLAEDIAAARAGGLALFTSRRHMEEAFQALPEHLRERVLVQGAMPRTLLLAEHRRRVKSGPPASSWPAILWRRPGSPWRPVPAPVDHQAALRQPG